MAVPGHEQEITHWEADGWDLDATLEEKLPCEKVMPQIPEIPEDTGKTLVSFLELFAAKLKAVFARLDHMNTIARQRGRIRSLAIRIYLLRKQAKDQRKRGMPHAHLDRQLDVLILLYFEGKQKLAVMQSVKVSSSGESPPEPPKPAVPLQSKSMRPPD